MSTAQADTSAPDLPADIATPAYVVDIARLKRNLATAARIRSEAGCKVLLATKAFALPAVFPIMREVLDGTTASGEYEARLGAETFGREVHVYAPAFSAAEIQRVLRHADHIYFNSAGQLERFGAMVKAVPGKKIGIRINPGYSNATLGGPLYDPCAPYSRFGATRDTLDRLPWSDIDILHAHALCESLHAGSIGLIEHLGREFATYIARVKINPVRGTFNQFGESPVHITDIPFTYLHTVYRTTHAQVPAPSLMIFFGRYFKCMQLVKRYQPGAQGC